MSTRTRARSPIAPAQGPARGPAQDQVVQLEGNAFAQEQLRARTPRGRFQQRYLEQRDREVDPSIPRWRRLSEDEVGQLPQEGAPGPGELGYTTQIGEDTWQYAVQPHDPMDPTRAGDLMGGSADQFYSRAFVVPGQEDRQDVQILNRDGTSSTQEANRHGMVELPTSGFGYTTHNRNDVRANGRPQPDQWGTPDAVARTINTMADYRTLFPNSTLSLGDLSTDTGNSPLLYSNRSVRHASHYEGSQLDLRYPSGEGSSSQVPRTEDDRFRFNALMEVGSDWGFDNFHVGPSMQRDQVFFPEGANGHFTRGHDNHLHMGQGSGRR